MLSLDQTVDVPGYLSYRSVLALIWTTFSLACLFVIFRCVIRLKFLGRLATEDYWIILALATLLTNAVLQTIQLPSLYYISAVGSGNIAPSADTIPIGNDYVRLEFAIIGLFWTVLWCVKASFLALYFKLFLDVPMYRLAWYVLVVFAFLAYVGCWIASFMTCHPISDYFNFSKCNKPEDILVSTICVYYSTVVDILLDLCIIAMPIKLIYNVQISMKQKAGLSSVFGLCLVIIIFAIIRAKQILVQSGFPNTILLEIWSTLESSIAVIIGCLPAFKSLISSRAATKRTNYGYSGSGHKSRATGNSRLRSTSIPLDSFSNGTKSQTGRHLSTSDSQEEMVTADELHGIVVKNDVTVSFNETNGPLPVYDNHQAVPNTSRRFRS